MIEKQCKTIAKQSIRFKLASEQNPGQWYPAWGQSLVSAQSHAGYHCPGFCSLASLNRIIGIIGDDSRREGLARLTDRGRFEL